MSKIENLDQNYSLKKIDKETINIKVHNNDVLVSVVGEFNSNLNELEKLTKTQIFFRGNSITIKGNNDEINTASEAIKFLINKYLKTNLIEKQDLMLSVKEKSINFKSNVHNLDQLIKTPKKTVNDKPKIASSLFPLIIAWWAQVTVAPELNRTAVFNKGTEKEFKGFTP